MDNKTLAAIPINEWTDEQILSLQRKRILVKVGNLRTGETDNSRNYFAIVLDVRQTTAGLVVDLISEHEAFKSDSYVMECLVRNERFVFFEIIEEVSFEELLTHGSSKVRNYITKASHASNPS